MNNDRNSDWIQTFTGRKFWPLEPRAEDVCIEDIAHALSMKCRFTGHCREFYSVAQHSVLVSEVVAAMGGDADLQLCGLMHDSAEAYLPDVASPIKSRIVVKGPPWRSYDAGFSDVEEWILVSVFEGLKLLSSWPDQSRRETLHAADIIMLCTEARDLMDADWTANFNPPFLWNKVIPQSPGTAKARFLARFADLDARRRVGCQTPASV